MRSSPAFPRLITAAAALGAAVVLFLVYRPAFEAPFVFDDMENIVDNPGIRMTSLSPESALTAMRAEGLNELRPVAYLSFGLNHLASGLDAPSFRAVNTAILVLSALVLFGTARLILRRFLPPEGALVAAGGTALIWAAHPLLTNGVTYIVQRMTSLAALFYLLAFFCYLLGRRQSRFFFVPSLLSFALALATKEISVVLPAAIILYEFSADPAFGGRFRRVLLTAFFTGIAAGLLVLAVRYAPSYERRAFTMAERLLTEGRVVLHYVGLFLAPLPARFNLDYDFPLSVSLLRPPATLAALLFHGASLAAAAALWRRKPLVSLCVLLFYLHHLLESTVLPLEIIFEHRMYLPSVFLALLVAVLVTEGLGRILGERRGRRAALTCFAALFLVLALATLQRNRVWADPVRLWEDVTAKSPAKPRGWNNLGEQYLYRGEYAKALGYFGEALERDPGMLEAAVNRGVTHIYLKDYRTALERLLEAERHGLEHRSLFYHIALSYHGLGRLDDAWTYYRRSLEADPVTPEARYGMAVILMNRGRYREALDLALEEARLYPENRKNAALVDRLRRLAP